MVPTLVTGMDSRDLAFNTPPSTASARKAARDGNQVERGVGRCSADAAVDGLRRHDRPIYEAQPEVAGTAGVRLPIAPDYSHLRRDPVDLRLPVNVHTVSLARRGIESEVFPDHLPDAQFDRRRGTVGPPNGPGRSGGLMIV